MRGKHDQSELLHLWQGNIPAYAGKTVAIVPHGEDAEEHPRVCGENDREEAIMNLEQGTSPRMRGKHRLWPSLQPPRRNIPAYAGKTTK